MKYYHIINCIIKANGKLMFGITCLFNLFIIFYFSASWVLSVLTGLAEVHLVDDNLLTYVKCRYFYHWLLYWCPMWRYCMELNIGAFSTNEFFSDVLFFLMDCFNKINLSLLTTKRAGVLIVCMNHLNDLFTLFDHANNDCLLYVA